MKVFCFLISIIVVSGCNSFYNELQKKHSNVSEKYYNSDSSFVLTNFIICNVNGRYSRLEKTSSLEEDSIISIFSKSLSKLGINYYRNEGTNLSNEKLCMYSYRRLKYANNYIDSLLLNTSLFSKGERYIVPFIRLIDSALNTSFRTGNVYINKFAVGIIVFIIEDKKIIYSKYYQGNGVSDNKEKVTDDWPNYPSPPDVLYEQAHWDTLVGLAMEDYMKRLNVEK